MPPVGAWGASTFGWRCVSKLKQVLLDTGVSL